MTPQINILHLRRNPFIKLIIPLIISLLLSPYINIHLQTIVLIFGFSFIVTTILFIQNKWIKNFKTNYVFGILIFVNLFLFGLSYSSYKSHQTDNNYQNYLEKNTIIKGKIIELLVEKTNSFETVIAVTAIINNTEKITTYGKIKCYFPKEEKEKLPKIGDIIIFKSRLNEITPPTFPHEFNYKNYLTSQSILHSTFIPINKFSIVDTENSIYSIAQNLRQGIINKFKETGLKQNELDILSALFLGHKQSLSKETKNSFTNAGAMHVLAVSGLHVGIILYLLTFVFDFIFGKTKYKKLKIILILLLIWGFALLTGLSISVLRSAIMFSFIAIGSLYSNKINIYNSIAASAFVILIIKPSSLIDIGFQLSYIAVLGIVYFYPKIYNAFYLKNRVLNQIWSISAVSIAAQIVTVPLSIYYFNQVPVYAIFSNLFVIYFAIVIISLGIIALLTIFYHPAFNFITLLIEYTITILNYLINTIATLPYATISNLYITGYQLSIIYISITLIILYLEKRNTNYTKLILLFLSLFLILEHVENYKLAQKKELIIYNTRNDLTFNIISNKTNAIYTSDTTETNLIKLRKGLQNKWGINDLNLPEFNYVNQTTNYEIISNNKSILILNTPINSPIDKIYNYIILNNNELSLSSIVENVKAMEYIIGSNINKNTSKSFIIENRYYNFKITEINLQFKLSLNSNYCIKKVKMTL